MSRYARQEVILGVKAQASLAKAHVLVVGAGGLGSPVLQYLVGAGVGEITIMDHDTVEESNLHRQPLYDMGDVGRPKTLAACAHLNAANPQPRLHPHLCKLTPSTAISAIAHVDLVIDAADSFAVSYILSDLCLTSQTPLISASVLGTSGYVGAFCGTAPSLRAVFPDLPDSAGSCARNGVLGPVVGMIGTTQAQMALAVLTDQTPSPMGRLVTMDAQTFTFGGFSFLGAPEPDVAMPFVDAAALAGQDQLIELRCREECPEAFHPTAQRIAPPDIAAAPLDKNHRVVLACQSGLRAWQAGQRLKTLGFENVALFAQAAA
ncbi:HesA/MoeB/ThiF family protein [uncultured Pelagimonas sp.]|uniref:HesA/MoeB/ThiF family protein n=1 Tax=uncultured Pelagimonas sp. TaxID=1618102 RepID=UPI00260F0113|nr:HesA/MoeB/ThiF family protein [uncultured Pelagimonas sp.]